MHCFLFLVAWASPPLGQVLFFQGSLPGQSSDRPGPGPPTALAHLGMPWHTHSPGSPKAPARPQPCTPTALDLHPEQVPQCLWSKSGWCSVLFSDSDSRGAECQQAFALTSLHCLNHLAEADVSTSVFPEGKERGEAGPRLGGRALLQHCPQPPVTCQRCLPQAFAISEKLHKMYIL